MPLTAPLEAINVFVDFFGQTPTRGPRGPLSIPQGPSACCLRGKPISSENPEVIGGPCVAASPWNASTSRGKWPIHEGPLEKGPVEGRTCVYGSSAPECGFCVPSLFVLTHAHSDHMRGLRPSWGKNKGGTAVASRNPNGGVYGGYSRGSRGPRGPIVCTETTRKLLLRTYPQLEPYLLPLQLQAPYLFYVHRASVEAPVEPLSGSPGNPHTSEQHTTRGPWLVHLKGEEAIEGEVWGPADSPDEVSESNEGKALQEAHTEDIGGGASRARQQTWSQFLVERAAAAARSSSSSSPGGSSFCFCGRDVDRVYIQLVDARHCPGSALLLLRSPVVGSYVHTGDFCCSGSNLQPLLQQVQQGLQLLRQLEDPAVAAAASAADTPEQACDNASIGRIVAADAGTSEQQLLQLHVDVLYLDSTYLHPCFSFLSQDEAVAEMCLLVKEALKKICGKAPSQGTRDPPTHHFGGPAGSPPFSLHVVIGVDKLGKESLLQQLATALKAPVRLSEAHFDSLAAAGYDDCCTSSLEVFKRGFGCPVVTATTGHRHGESNSSSSSSRRNSTRCSSHREMPACGCPWIDEGSAGFPSSPDCQRQQQLKQHNQQQHLSQETDQERFGLCRANPAAAAVASVCLFAVPRRQLVKVVEALEASGLPTLGLIPSGGGLSVGTLPSIRSIPISSHSSFSSLMEFVKALNPQKVVLLERLPVPSCGCGALRKPSSTQGHQTVNVSCNSSSSSSTSKCSSWGGNPHHDSDDEVHGPIVRGPKSGDTWKPQQRGHVGALDAPVALLLDDPETVDTILTVRARGLEGMGTSSSSTNSALPTLCKSFSASTVAVSAEAARSGLVAASDSCSVYGAFKYNGIEGLSVFVRTTEVPIVVLGSGRRPFCPHEGPCRGISDPCSTKRAHWGAHGGRQSASVFSVQQGRLKRRAPSLPAVCTRHSDGPTGLHSAPRAAASSACEGSVMPLKKVNRRGRALRFVL